MLLYISKHILSYKKNLLSNEQMFRCNLLFSKALMQDVTIYLLWRKWLPLFLVMDQKMSESIERLFFALKEVDCVVSAIFIPHIFACTMCYCFLEERQVGILTFHSRMKMAILNVPNRLLNFCGVHIDFTFILQK